MHPSNLDRELEQALKSTEAAAQASTAEALPVTITASGPNKRTKGNVGLLIALLLMASGLLVIVLTSFKSAAVYAKHVDEVVASRQELVGRTLRVEGMLVHGTLERRDVPCEYRFKMERNGQTLAVRYPQCVVPDTFRDEPGVEIGVTVEGKLGPGGDFQASQVMAKCPSKYEQRAKSGSQASTAPAL
jgi:cytochrome c-type biogenesis protein CcmE